MHGSVQGSVETHRLSLKRLSFGGADDTGTGVGAGFVSVVVDAADNEPSPFGDDELILESRQLGASSLEMARRWERRRARWWWNAGESAPSAPGRISRHGIGYGAALTWLLLRAFGSQSMLRNVEIGEGNNQSKMIRRREGTDGRRKWAMRRQQKIVANESSAHFYSIERTTNLRTSSPSL